MAIRKSSCASVQLNWNQEKVKKYLLTHFERYVVLIHIYDFISIIIIDKAWSLFFDWPYRCTSAHESFIENNVRNGNLKREKKNKKKNFAFLHNIRYRLKEDIL